MSYYGDPTTDMLPPDNRLSVITQGEGRSAKATLAHYKFKRMLSMIALAQ